MILKHRFKYKKENEKTEMGQLLSEFCIKLKLKEQQKWLVALVSVH